MVNQALSLTLLLLINLVCSAQDSTESKYVTINKLDTSYYSSINLDHFEDYRFKHRKFNALSGNIGLSTHFLDSIDLPSYNGFFNGYSASLFTGDQIHFYKQEKDITLLQYINGAKKEQYFRVFHSNQFGQGLNLSFDYNRIISEGFYLNQLTDNTHFNTSLNFQSKNQKYRLKMYYLISNLKVQENGGIEFSDSTDESLNNSDLLNVNLSSATKKMRSQSVFLGQELMLIDTSIFGSIRLLQESELAWSWKWYKDNGVTDYYETIYYDSTKTYDSIHALQFRNSIGLSIFDNQVKLKYEHQYHSYRQDSLFDTLYLSNFLIGEINKNYKRINFNLQGRLGLSGYNSGDFMSLVDINYSLDSNSSLELMGSMQTQSPYYWQNRFNGNHVMYSNNFDDQKLSRIAVYYSNQKYKLNLGVSQTAKTNTIYNINDGSPLQFKDPVSITQFSLNKDFNFGRFYLNNTIKYQIISNDSIIPLPSILSSHTLYYEHSFFNENLLIQTGLTYRYIGEYGGYGYFPENSVLTIQNNTKLGNFGYLDLFFKFRIQHVRVFVKMENLFGNEFKPDGMMINDYPIPGRVFKVGLSWALFN